ncbi:MAG: Ger(x)C family spore germination protein [Thermoflavifilum sp.]|nr:Ger(x)C family spore germination protein [Thermoflavifilum sp.]MCL6513251.1 Ger(x)C family spore germination protein [Alicyclobacillus sp.]
MGRNHAARGRFARLRRCAATICAVVSLSLLTAGCFDRQELEQQAFVTSIAIDKAPDGMVDCTFRIALPVNTAGGSSSTGKDPQAGTTPVTYRARSITEAMALANTSVERVLTFTHLTSVLIGEDLAREGISQQLQPLVRYREFRRTVMLAIAKGKARDFLLSDQPMLERSPARMADALVQVGDSSGLIPGDRLHDFLTALENPHEDPVASLVAVNAAVQQDPQGKSGIQGDNVSYDAGSIRRAGGNPVEWAGTAVFQGDKLVGYLNARETILLQLLRGRLRRTKLEFPDPQDPTKTVGLILRRERSPQYDIRLSDPLRVTVRVPLDVDLTSTEVKTDYTLPGNREYLERQLTHMMEQEMEALLIKLERQYRADVVPISRQGRPKFATYQQFAAYRWEEKLPDAQYQVQPDLHIRRFGVQFGPVQNRAGNLPAGNISAESSGNAVQR